MSAKKRFGFLGLAWAEDVYLTGFPGREHLFMPPNFYAIGIELGK
jgi:hypothetical protein